MQWTGFDFFKPRKSDLEQLNEKQRECAALQHKVEQLRADMMKIRDSHTIEYAHSLAEMALTDSA